MSFARNRSLDVLIPELSSNITLSLINNPLVTAPTPAKITTATPVALYIYHVHPIILAYALALSFALLENLLGLYAYRANSASH